MQPLPFFLPFFLSSFLTFFFLLLPSSYYSSNKASSVAEESLFVRSVTSPGPQEPSQTATSTMWLVVYARSLASFKAGSFLAV